MKEIIFAGFGGQGVLTAGLVLAKIASDQGRKVVWMPSYGAQMRGGRANSVVKYGDDANENIGSPIMESADVLVVMNAPSASFCSFCKPGALILVNSHAVPETVSFPDEYIVIRIDCVELADNAGNPKALNLVMLGAAIKAAGLFPVDEAEQQMCGFFEEKGKGKYNESNIRAFREGVNAVSGE